RLSPAGAKQARAGDCSDSPDRLLASAPPAVNNVPRPEDSNRGGPAPAARAADRRMLAPTELTRGGPARQRRCAPLSSVFRGPALLDELTVYEDVAPPLRLRNRPPVVVRGRAENVARLKRKCLVWVGSQ